MSDNIGFNIDNMELTSKNFIVKLEGLGELRHHDDCKLGVYKDVTYVSWRRFQNLNRWWYNENRAKLIDFLTTTFEEYYLFNEMMREALNVERQPQRKRRLLKLNDTNRSKMKAWSTGNFVRSGTISPLRESQEANRLCQNELLSTRTRILVKFK